MFSEPTFIEHQLQLTGHLPGNSLGGTRIALPHYKSMVRMKLLEKVENRKE